MRLLLITSLSFGLFVSSCSQSNSTEAFSEDRNNALLVAEFQKESSQGQLQHLVSYNFKNGVLVSKDTILSTPTFKNDSRYVRYEFGDNFVYKNRFVVSGTGNVIDIENKVLLEKTGDDYITAKGDSLVFHRDNIFTGTGYLLADLKKWNYSFIEDTNFMKVKGIHSPNHLLALEINESKYPNEILINKNNNQKQVIVNDCGSGTLLSRFASTRPMISVIWIDNKNFLYASYNSIIIRDSLIPSMANISIYKVNLRTKESVNIAQIDSVLPALSNSNFLRNPEKKIIFNCSKGQYEIDLGKNKAIPYNMSSVANEFSIENKPNVSGRFINFQNSRIGKVWCNYYNAKTTKGFLAIEYADIASNLGYPKGVRVWNNINNKWINIEIPWISGMIGWVEK